MIKALLVTLLLMVPFSSYAMECPKGLKTPQAVLMNTPSKLGNKPVTYSDPEVVSRVVRNIYEYNLRSDTFRVLLKYPREFITSILIFRADNVYGKYIIMLISKECVLQSFYAPPFYRNAVIGLDL